MAYGSASSFNLARCLRRRGVIWTPSRRFAFAQVTLGVEPRPRRRRFFVHPGPNLVGISVGAIATGVMSYPKAHSDARSPAPLARQFRRAVFCDRTLAVGDQRPRGAMVGQSGDRFARRPGKRERQGYGCGFALLSQPTPLPTGTGYGTSTTLIACMWEPLEKSGRMLKAGGAETPVRPHPLKRIAPSGAGATRVPPDHGRNCYQPPAALRRVSDAACHKVLRQGR